MRCFFWPKTGDLKKKNLRRNSKGFSGRNQKFQGFFWPKTGDLKKNKKIKKRSSPTLGADSKKIHYSGPNNNKSFTTSAPKSLWGGCFHYWSKNRPQKHKKCAILYTFQANGGARAPPSYLAIWQKSSGAAAYRYFNEKVAPLQLLAYKTAAAAATLKKYIVKRTMAFKCGTKWGNFNLCTKVTYSSFGNIRTDCNWH